MPLQPGPGYEVYEAGGLRVVEPSDLRECGPDHCRPEPPMLLACANAERVTVGPLYVPGQSACFACVGHWARTAGWDRPAAGPAPEAARQALADAVHGVAAEFARSGGPPELYRGIREVRLSGDGSLHPVYSRADCPRCGTSEENGLPLAVHCSPLTGIVRSVHITAQPFAGAYAAAGEFVAPLPLPGARLLVKAQFSFGKGQSREAALDGCIAEALERYSLVFTGSEPLRRARMEELPCIDPREILLHSPRQYETREEWNRTHSERFHVPEPFDAGRALDFLPGLDLAAGKPVGVPAACCLMWYRFGAGEPHFANADSIGCGAGRSLADATASALLEWVERDATAIWWYNRLRRQGTDPREFGSEPLDRVCGALARAGRTLHLLDATTDLGIPVYVAVAPNRRGGEPVFAAAAHPSPRTAAWKAAAEIVQILFALRQLPEADADLHDWLAAATVESEPYLQPAAMVPPPAEPAPLSTREQVELCVRRMAGAGLRPIAVDHSRPDVLLRAVRVVAPGMRHIWARFAPGRLYDVPVRQGWLAAPTPEDGLNSIPCMI